tara:strand:- start:800 stop:1729 length:930 start_codon:yes stop_codon:yes gene_type:complete
MNCKITTAPIDIPPSVNEVGGDNTDFYYDYGKSTCSITNKKTYLDINCFDGNNKVGSGLTGDLYVSNVRLYKPSLNSYNGAKADAELIITHSGGGKNLYVCIPITSTTASGGSTDWFNQIIPFSPSKTNDSKSIHVSNFTLNMVIPKTPFIVYEGGTFDWGCSKSDVMILFNLDSSININYKNLKTLGNIIEEASYNISKTPDYLKSNKKGTISGPGKISGSQKSSTLTCTPITDQNGKNIDELGETRNSSTWVKTSSDIGDKVGNKLEQYWIIIIGIIVGIIAIILIVMVIRAASKTTGGSSPTGRNT